PDPGGQPRPNPGRREIRLQARLQAFDLRDLVDSPGDHPCAGRPGPDDPAARARRRAGAQGHARPPRARPEAEPRGAAAGDRKGERLPARAGPHAAGADRGPRQPGDARRRRREPLRRPDRGHELRPPGCRNCGGAPVRRALGGAASPRAEDAPRALAALRPRRRSPADARGGRSRPRHHPRARAPARVPRSPRAADGRAGPLDLRRGFELPPAPPLLEDDPARYVLEGTRLVLVEVPFAGLADELWALAEHIEGAGLAPLVAHPERTEAVRARPELVEEL